MCIKCFQVNCYHNSSPDQLKVPKIIKCIAISLVIHTPLIFVRQGFLTYSSSAN